MVEIYSLKPSKKLNKKRLESFLEKLILFHIKNLENPENFSMHQELEKRRKYLEEELNTAYNRVNLTQSFRVSTLDIKNEKTIYVRDPFGEKRKTAENRFRHLLNVYPEFSDFKLQLQYQR